MTPGIPQDPASTPPFAEVLGELRLISNQPRLLDDPGEVWWVATGSVDVFTVRVEEHAAAGARHHLLRVGPGQALFGLDLDDPQLVGLGLLAVAMGEARVARVSLEAWRRAFVLPDRQDAALELVSRWVSQVSAGLTLRPRRAEAIRAGAPEQYELGAGASITPLSGVLCARVVKGAAFFTGEMDLPVDTGSGPVLLCQDTWVETRGECTVRTETLAAAVTSDSLAELLTGFHRLSLQALDLRLLLEEVREEARLMARDLSLQQTFERTLAGHARVLERGAAGAQTVASGDDLLAAMRQVGDFLGARVQEPPPGIKGRVRDPVAAIARASRIRFRRVDLEEGWWAKDCGPLLGFLGGSKRPVALLPVSPRAYRLVDPSETGNRTVDRDLAARLQPLAYTFYRPLPERPLTARDLLAHALHGRGRDLWMVALAGLAGGIVGLAVPVATNLVFSQIVPAGDSRGLVGMVSALVVAGLAAGVFSLTRAIALVRLQGKGDSGLQAAIWDRLLQLPASFFRTYSAGDLATRILSLNEVSRVLYGTVASAVLSAVFALVNLGLMFYYSRTLAALALALILLALGLFALLARLQLEPRRRLSSLQGRLAGVVFQLVSAAAKLRDTGAEERAFARWSDVFTQMNCASVEASRLVIGAVILNAVYPLFCTLATFAVYISVLQGGLDTGRFLGYAAASSQLLGTVLLVGISFISLVGIAPVYERAVPLLQAELEVDPSRVDPGELRGEIRVSHATFSYVPGGRKILDDVSFDIRPGEAVAFVGPSGAGKSTIFRLLLGFELPEAGEIYYDGHNLRNLDPTALRHQLSVVLQNGRVFSGSILENIVGASSATMEQAWSAARGAGLEEDIKAMPMGMHTYVSEGGVTFSGGQRQRLMIARALVTKPRILLFDEATSSLDNRTQAIVTEGLDALNATRVFIAQRLSTVMSADRIYVLEAGRVVQTGSFAELMAEPGLFQELARRQLA